jgi:hypothetical protein
MCGYESVGLLDIQTRRDSNKNMPETEKNKAARQTEKPVPLADSSSQENAGAANSGKHAGSPAEVEIGGRNGPEPTRFGDWEKNGRCTDF